MRIVLVLAAQSVGLPCIVTDAEGLAESVSHEVTGWVVAKRSPQALADALRKDHSLAEQQLFTMQRNARSRVEYLFNVHDQIPRFKKLYENLLCDYSYFESRHEKSSNF